MCESEEGREARIGAALVEAEHDLAAWLLAQMLDESEQTIDRLGHAMYAKLADALGVHRNSDALLALAFALLASGSPRDRAQSMLTDYRTVSDDREAQ